MKDQARDERKDKPHKTGMRDAAASEPEVRPEDVIPPYIPDRSQHVPDREDGLDQEQLDHELDEGNDDSFPASDPPAIVSPHRPPDRDQESDDRE